MATDHLETHDASRDVGRMVVEVYVSSQKGDRLSRKADLYFDQADASLPTLAVEEETRYQEIVGFGASFNEAGMICLNALDAAAQGRVLEALFDPVRGAGFTAMKSPIAACDFASAGPWYSYDETPGDVTLSDFSIARDLGPNGLLAFVRKAQRFGSFVLQATMDFPPDWMMYGLGSGEKHVRPEYYDALARYYVKYVQAYRAQGVTIDYLSPFNEPEDGWYTDVTYEAIRNMIEGYIGPRFEAAGLQTRIQVSDSSNRPQGRDRFPVVLDDPGARRYVDSAPVHGYDWSEYAVLTTLHDRYPDVPIWMTEVCYALEDENVIVPPGGPSRMPVYEFADGAYWGNMIVEDMKHWVSAWIYWNLVLDQEGGPWLISETHGDPDNNRQHPVVIVNRDTGEVTYTGLYYYLAHFSRFVRPGAYRIEAAGSASGVNSVAFQNVDGSIVLNVVNSGGPTSVQVGWRGRGLRACVPGHSIETLKWMPM
jgi:glucosylceramidase